MSAGPLFTTENVIQTSGLATSVLDFYGSQKGYATAQSGAQTITSGTGVLFAVIGITGQLSGAGGAVVSQSGCTITVIDAVSGATANFQSGASAFATNTAGVLYQHNFGTQSGLQADGQNAKPPSLTGINAIFRSGLNVVISGGIVGTVGVSVIYGKGI